MRKIIYILVILLAAGNGSMRAASATVSEKVLQSFHNQFLSAKEVNWNTIKDKGLYKACFKYNDRYVEALYNEEGELISIARLIEKDFLPIMVMNKLNSNYADYAIRQIVEMSSAEAVSYLVTAYNAKESVLLQINSTGDSHQVKRTKNK